MNETEYSYLKRKIRVLLGIDIDAYKSQQMRRRIEAFVARHSADGAFRFAKALEQDHAVLKALKDMLTINVSEFFRDQPKFAYLKSVILPDLLRNSPRLNIWTAGCSHGQEPYSVAMLLDELPDGKSHRLLATDIDSEALARARAGGPYQPNDLKNVSKPQLQRYFSPLDQGHMVVEELRRRIQFREHNMLADPFAAGFDLVLCRNVMIYFSEEAKRTLFQRFSDSLKPTGVLFLGGTEAVLAGDDVGLERLSTNFYRRSEVATGAATHTRAA